MVMDKASTPDTLLTQGRNTPSTPTITSPVGLGWWFIISQQ